MTTINNLTIEQMREIVEGAPVECAYYGLVNNIVIYYQWSKEWLWHNSNTNEYERDFSKSMKFGLNDLRTAIAEHDSKIKCWSCDKYMTKSQRSANDGFCIHCSNEVDLGCNHNFEDVTIYGDSHKTYQCTICEFRDEEAERHG